MREEFLELLRTDQAFREDLRRQLLTEDVLASVKESCMQIAYIKFNSREDQVRGFYELATKAQVASLPGGVYAVPWKALSLLDEQNISYRRATDAEVPLKHGSIRTPVAPLL
jgi:hypothetical protein